MYIKKITISGFKSYRDVTAVGPFDPAHNVVVGRNGSGKSNFFDAVRFVLSDKFANLRSEERVALLHEGAGASVLSAYVEIMFDNSDRRLPADKNEVALRRMIGLKKDEYMLDRRNVTRTEIFNILESAGFSRSNPYYIVQQGKVASLCAMTDSQRVDLLKEVAGTRVYDERREESMRIMQETEGKRAKITEVVEYIEKRLAELEGEKDELKDYQKYDKERRAIEYMLYMADLDNAKLKLEELEQSHAEEHDRNRHMFEESDSLKARIDREELQEKEAVQALTNLEAQYTTVEKEVNEISSQIAALEAELNDAQETAQANHQLLTKTKKRLASVQRKAKTKRDELTPLLPQLESAREQHLSLKSKLSETDHQILTLRAKSGRTSDFGSKKERDRYLKQEIETLKRTRDTAAMQADQAATSAAQTVTIIENTKTELEEKRRAIESQKSQISEGRRDNVELLKKRDELYSQRQELWRKGSDHTFRATQLREEVSRNERSLRTCVGNLTSLAWSAVQDILESHPNLKNRVLGPLYSLIEVDPKFMLAAEVSAGAALTHIVVDSDDTGAKLIRLLQSRRGGRVTFIPLNRVGQKWRPMEPTEDGGALPLISKIISSDRVRPAVQQVFGRYMVARDMEVATKLANTRNVDCITLGGDMVSKRGALTGGFVDSRKSKLMSMQELRKSRSLHEEATREKDEVEERVQNAEASLSNLVGKIQESDVKWRIEQDRTETLEEECLRLQRSVSLLEQKQESYNHVAEDLRTSVEESNRSIASFSEELQTDLKDGLSHQEQSYLEQLTVQATTLRNEVVSRAKVMSLIEVQVSTIRAELERNFDRQMQELNDKITELASASADEPDGTAAPKSHQLAAVRQTAAREKERLSELGNSISLKKGEIKDLNNSIDDCRTKLGHINVQVGQEEERVVNLYNRRSQLCSKRDEAERKIRDLGPLPSDINRLHSKSISSLKAMLTKVNNSLKMYAHVNKKALDQYMSFTEKRDALQERGAEMDAGAEAIRDLIDSLDARKDEDIMRTFRGVAKSFSQVFEELVPGGKAQLVLLTDADEARDPEDDPQEADMGARAAYTGVAMKVAFLRGGDVFLLQQLSGGQKSIVALALIFAIQRLDPAPFYLFDEIDANLDATHRQAVANLIKAQSSAGTQFISTTFRQEFVAAGNKWFGVTHRQKISDVSDVQRSEALDFISDEPDR